MQQNYTGSYKPQTQNWNNVNSQFGNGRNQSPMRPSTDPTQFHISNLTKSPSIRMESVQYLSQNRDSNKDIGQILWDTPGVMAAILSDIMSIYPAMTSVATNPSNYPSPLTQQQVTHVCNCIALLQSIAGHPEVRGEFIQSKIPSYLFPFIHATNQSRECEMLKMASLGVIGNLAKSLQPDVIAYLTNSELTCVPLCLRVLKFGQEGNKIIAAFIIACIASDKIGLSTICSSDGNRLLTALGVLNKVVAELAKQYSPYLAKNIVIAYNAILSFSPQARETALRIAAQDLGQTKLAQNVNEDFQKLFLTLTQSRM